MPYLCIIRDATRGSGHFDAVDRISSSTFAHRCVVSTPNCYVQRRNFITGAEVAKKSDWCVNFLPQASTSWHRRAGQRVKVQRVEHRHRQEETTHFNSKQPALTFLLNPSASQSLLIPFLDLKTCSVAAQICKSMVVGGKYSTVCTWKCVLISGMWHRSSKEHTTALPTPPSWPPSLPQCSCHSSPHQLLKPSHPTVRSSSLLPA